MTNDTDEIYLEPGSVWRRGDEWRILQETYELIAEYRTFGSSIDFHKDISTWLAWAKHHDTVLVYSPSGNKLPVKDGWVRKRIAVIVDSDGEVFDGYGNSFSDEHEEEFWATGAYKFVEFDLKVPVPSEPEIVEGSVSE